MRAKQAGRKADVVREKRLEAAARIVELARERRADVLILAGDTFEDNAVDAVLVRRVVDILLRSSCPVLVLPGNHDPLGPGSIFGQSAWKDAFPKVTVLTSTQPLLVADAWIVPSPCEARWSSSDPTLRLAPPANDGRIRIGVAHGSLRDHGFEVPGDDHPIAGDAAERAGVDYLALGHWHSTLVLPSIEKPRLAYAGTPETTSYGERDSGNCLLVTIERAGGGAQVEVLRTGTLHWEAREETFKTDDDVRRRRAEIEALPAPGSTLVRLRLYGVLGPSGFERLRELIDAATARFLSVAIDMEGVMPRPEDAEGWLRRVPDGVPRSVAEKLLTAATTDADSHGREVAMHALTKLLTLAQRVSP
jgi:DNA repair exonuclease SbcCD nuclease subunit